MRYGTVFDDVLFIDDFALEDGAFNFDDAPFFEDGATFLMPFSMMTLH